MFHNMPYLKLMALSNSMSKLLCFMHQSFVTMTPMGPGNSMDTDFSLCKARVYARHCGDNLMVKALLKSQQLNVKLVQPVWTWNQKPCYTMALQG